MPKEVVRGRWGLVAALAGLLLLPGLIGLLVGWYGLNPPEAESLSPVGSESHLLLNSFPDDHLVLEVDYQRSVGPAPASVLATLVARAQATCAKGSVTVEQFPFDSSMTQFSEGDLLATAAAQRHDWPAWGRMSVQFLYLDGQLAGDANVLGLAFRGSSIAVFPANLAAHAGGAPTDGALTTVLVHEFGHELGLVGIIGSAPNQDPQHPYHSNDPNDVMYWSVDSTSFLLGLFGHASPTNFSAADLSDLATVKSTPIPAELLPPIVLALTTGTAVVVVLLVLRRRRAARRSGASSPPSPKVPTGP